MEKKSVAKNYIYNLVFQLLTVILPLITTPYVSRVLGATNMGIYGYTFSIVTYFMLFGSLGISMYGQREIAYVQKDKEKQSEIFTELVLMRILTNVLAIIIFFFVFCGNNEYRIYYRILLFELVAGMIDISWYFQGIEEFSKPVIRNAIVKIVALFLIFIFVKSESDLWIYFLIYALGDFLGNLTLWLYIPRYIRPVVRKKLKFKYHIAPILALFLPQIATQVYTVLDKTMIGQIVKDMDEVGYYDQAQKIIRALTLIVTAMGTVVASRVANAYAEGDDTEMTLYLKKSISMVWMIAVPCCLGMIAVSSSFVPLYYGTGYEPVEMLLNTMSVVLIFVGLSNITGVQYLIQVGRQREYTISIVVGAVANFILNIVLLNCVGTIGAVFATVFAEFLIFIVQARFASDKIHMLDLVKSSIHYLVAGAIMCIVVTIFLTFVLDGMLGLSISIVIGAVVYAAVLFLINDEFFMIILSMLVSKFRKR